MRNLLKLFLTGLLLCSAAFAQKGLTCENEPASAAFGIQVSQGQYDTLITASPLPCTVQAVAFTIMWSMSWNPLGAAGPIPVGCTNPTTNVLECAINGAQEPRTLYYAAYLLNIPGTVLNHFNGRPEFGPITNLRITAVAIVGATVTYP
jgi:hypothetical protein